MEFDFNVNKLLPDSICKVNSSLSISGANVAAADEATSRRNQLLEIIEKMGEASAKAQDLQQAVTTAKKFISSDHTLYLVKDSAGNNKQGCVVGLLKTGRKKLFVLDTSGQQNEVVPLCVLDFYVHESRQRQGYGKQLFEYMLMDENVDPCYLAVDRPSPKFLSFLKKHYNLSRPIPQVNHFTVYEGFFQDSPNTPEGNCPMQRRRISRSPNEGILSSTNGNEQVRTRKDIEPGSGLFPAAASPSGQMQVCPRSDSAMNIFGIPSSWTQSSDQGYSAKSKLC